MQQKPIHIFHREVEDQLKAINGHEYLVHDLGERQFGLFDTLIIRRLSDGFFQLILTVNKMKEYPMKHIGRLINVLFLLYGSDDNGKGKLELADVEELQADQIWKGRKWLNPYKYSQPASLSYTPNEGLKLELMIV